MIIRAVDRLFRNIFQNKMVFICNLALWGVKKIVVYNHNDMSWNYI